MHRRIIAPGALAAASLLLAIPASAADFSPGAPGIGDPYYPAYGNGGYDVSHYDLRLKYQPATDELEGTATLAGHRHAGPVALQPGLRAGRQRGAGQRREGGVHDLRRARAGDHPDDAAGQGRRRSPSSCATAGVPSVEAGVRLHQPGTAPRTAGSRRTSPRRPGGGSRATTTRSTRRPTTSPSPSRTARRPSPTARSSRRVRRLGWTRYNWRSNKPQATYLATLAVGKFDITTGTTEGGMPGRQRLQQGPRRQRGRGAGERRADRRDRGLAEPGTSGRTPSTRSAGTCRT